MVAAFVIGPILSITSGQTNYMSTSPNPVRYFAFNSLLVFGLESGIGNLLSTAPFPFVINGSLWTLPTEIKSYFIVAFLAVLSKLVKSDLPLYLCMIFFVTIYLCDLFEFALTQSIFEASSLKLFVIFFSGAMCTKLCVTVNLRFYWWFLSVLSVISIFLLIGRESAPFLFWLVIPVLASTPIRIAHFFEFLNKRDYSYGMYLWAFPIAQVVVYFDFADSAISLAILGGLISFLCAVFSWHIVELPTLRAARRYISHQVEQSRTTD
jgi:peptidoglycan/LPS O-acetylase OafA/YrhL